MILKTNDLSIGYASKKQQKSIADEISIEVSKGIFLAVLGKNGVGKSTFLRTISGIQKPLEGEVFIHQKNIEKYSNSELATTIGLVLTEKLPESQLTVFELVALGRQPYTNWVDSLTEKDLEKVEWALDQTEISSLKNHPFYELSDGQLQRVLITRALAQDTDIIILDEPTAHLDIHHTIKIFSLLQKLAKNLQKTILISTHEVNLAIQLCNELIILSDEKIAHGTVTELIKKEAFSSLFPTEIIKFDASLQQFIMQQNK